MTAAVYASHDHGIALRPIAYSLDEGAAWEIYHDPLDFTTEGQYSLWFRVEDVLGNEMSEHVLIRIDHTNPEIELKPDGVVRLFGISTVVDRFIQQALLQVLTPIFEAHFVNDN